MPYKVTKPFGAYMPGDTLSDKPDVDRAYFTEEGDEGTDALDRAALQNRLDEADYTSQLWSWANALDDRTDDDTYEGRGRDKLTEFLLRHPQQAWEVIDED